MRILITVLSALLLLSACNGNSKNSRKAGKTEGVDTLSRSNPKDTTGGKKTKDPSFTWTKKEQKKFLNDCKTGARQQLTGEELRDYCTCMLTQSQKYYRTYREMEEEGNDDDDVKIHTACAGYFNEEEEEDQ